MRFLIDAQLPPALARFLADQGHEAEHVFDIGMNNAEDADIWTYAQTNDAVIVTKDEDFVNLALLREPAASVVWLRIGNTGKQQLLAWFTNLLPFVEKSLANGEKLIELV